MKTDADAPIFPRIVLAIVIVLGSALLWRLGYNLFTAEKLGPCEQAFLLTGFVTVVVAMFYVIVQRQSMKKTETFRREKW